MNPYKIDGPALISFSGGRTSGYMLAKIVEAHGGILPVDVIPVFANTGKEHPATLDFVRDCSDRIAPVTWLEYSADGFKVVSFETAARNGEPFEALIQKKKYLPNPVTRFCTIELKIRVMRDFARSLGWEHWTNVIGLRADEPRRVAKARNNRERWENDMPLHSAGVVKADVLAWWKAQGWGLNLPISPTGDTDLGNCDLCMLKGLGKKISIIRDDPNRAVWWMQQEEKRGATFRIDQPSYKAMISIATQPELDFEDEELADCACTD